MTQCDSETEDYLARGFRDVDAAAVGKMSRCLAYMDSLPGFQEYKTAILKLMKPQPGSVVADIGCGLGFDVRRLSALVEPDGRAIGVDSSLVLIESARSASAEFPCAEFVQADIQSLPFANGCLQSCKVDRTLQHVERPDAVLGEMFRTVRSGGTVVCAEPDWSTFAIEVPSAEAPHEITQQISRIWIEGIRHPRIGRELGKRLEYTGFVDLEVHQVVLSTSTFESSDIVFDVSQSALHLATSGASGEPLAWLSGLCARGDQVCCSVALVINFAHRP